MELTITNIGKIKSSNIKFDGITVICGENNSGKSTVGKTLFSLFNSMCNFEEKINEYRVRTITNCIARHLLSTNELDVLRGVRIEMPDIRNAFSDENDEAEAQTIEELLKQFPGIKQKDAAAEEIRSILSASDADVFAEYVMRYFRDVFNEQIKTEGIGSGTAKVTLSFRGGENSIRFYQKKCNVKQGIPILHSAYYIDNPFVLNFLNEPRGVLRYLTDLERNVVSAIQTARMMQSNDKMTDIFDSVTNKGKLQAVMDVLKQAYRGKTIIKNGLYLYHDESGDIDFRNISTGLKSFALIERMLEYGVLKTKDVLILDEPEIHLHPDWQLVYAELIVLLQKTYDLTILVVTHSFHFLEAMHFYIEKHGVQQKSNFYIAKEHEGKSVIESNETSLHDMMESLSKGPFKLADMKFEYLTGQSGYEDDTE